MGIAIFIELCTLKIQDLSCHVTMWTCMNDLTSDSYPNLESAGLDNSRNTWLATHFA